MLKTLKLPATEEFFNLTDEARKNGQHLLGIVEK